MLSRKFSIYLIASFALALSPAWVRYIILTGYPKPDKMGSGSDVFIWLLFTIVFFILLIIIQVIHFYSIDTNRKRSMTYIPFCFVMAWAVTVALLIYRP